MFCVAGERVYNNLTRLVLVVWLFVVLILSSSYTASLSSMLTLRQLEPDDTEWLKKNNLKVGCNNLFVKNYLVNVFEFKQQNIVMVRNREYQEQFKSNNIAAAVLEIPYKEIFLNKYCNGYTSTILRSEGFGGLSFVSSNSKHCAKPYELIS